jgi:hypothetical protein
MWLSPESLGGVFQGSENRMFLDGGDQRSSRRLV